MQGRADAWQPGSSGPAPENLPQFNSCQEPVPSHTHTHAYTASSALEREEEREGGRGGREVERAPYCKTKYGSHTQPGALLGLCSTQYEETHRSQLRPAVREVPSPRLSVSLSSLRSADASPRQERALDRCS